MSISASCIIDFVVIIFGLSLVSTYNLNYMRLKRPSITAIQRGSKFSAQFSRVLFKGSASSWFYSLFQQRLQGAAQFESVDYASGLLRGHMAGPFASQQVKKFCKLLLGGIAL